jgi:hypothetical protein
MTPELAWIFAAFAPFGKIEAQFAHHPGLRIFAFIDAGQLR